jgi:hypothetical protein
MYHKQTWLVLEQKYREVYSNHPIESMSFGQQQDDTEEIEKEKLKKDICHTYCDIGKSSPDCWVK